MTDTQPIVPAAQPAPAYGAAAAQPGVADPNSSAAAGQPAAAGGGNFTDHKAIQDANAQLSPGYTENLFDCCSDPVGCAITCCLPCLPLTATKAALDERPCTLCDALCGVSPYQNRQTMRAKYKKGFSPASDCVAFCCCPVCAIHQDVRELAKLTGKPRDFVNIMRE